MKKFFFISALLSHSFLFSQNSLDYTDLENEGLKGKVKSVKQQFYDAHDSSGKMVLYPQKSSWGDNYIQKYDSKGNETDKIEYSLNDTFLIKFFYKYDDKGNLIEILTTSKPNDSYRRIVCKYNEKNKCVEEARFSEGGEVYSKYTYKYDEKGNNTNENYFDYLDSTSNYTAIFKYNTEGIFESYQEFDWEKKIRVDITYKLDEKGEITESTDNLYPNPFGKTTRYTYDEKGNMTSQDNSNEFDDDTGRKKTWTYDAMGNITEINVQSSMGTNHGSTKYEYEYDKQGNWIKKTQYSDDELGQIIMRDIVYYQ